MKKFIYKSLLFVSLMLVLIGGISASVLFALPPQFNSTYQHALSLQYDSLEKLHSPKVVVMGDSSVPFSLNAPLMKKLLGMPVQTLGIHSGTGMEYILSLSKCNIHKGDIMVVELEPSGEDTFSPSVILTACENNFSMYRYFSVNDWKKVISYYPSYLIKKVKYSMNIRDAQIPAYDGHSFSRDGNYNYYRKNCTLPRRLTGPDEKTEFSKKGYTAELISYLNSYNRYCRERGATFLVSFPPFLNESLVSSGKDIKDLQNYLSRRLEAPVITKVTDRELSRMYIYNNVAHCNSAGADIVTTRLAREIQSYFKSHSSGVIKPKLSDPPAQAVNANRKDVPIKRQNVKMHHIQPIGLKTWNEKYLLPY